MQVSISAVNHIPVVDEVLYGCQNLMFQVEKDGPVSQSQQKRM